MQQSRSRSLQTANRRRRHLSSRSSSHGNRARSDNWNGMERALPRHRNPKRINPWRDSSRSTKRSGRRPQPKDMGTTAREKNQSQNLLDDRQSPLEGCTLLHTAKALTTKITKKYEGDPWMKSGKNPSWLVAWYESLFPLAEGWRGRLQTTWHLITGQQVHDIAEKSGIKIFWHLMYGLRNLK